MARQSFRAMMMMARFVEKQPLLKDNRVGAMAGGRKLMRLGYLITAHLAHIERAMFELGIFQSGRGERVGKWLGLG